MKQLDLNKKEASELAKGKMRACRRGSEGFGSCWQSQTHKCMLKVEQHL